MSPERVIGYPEAENLAGRLARRLTTHTGARELPVLAVPRGGLIVLGWLSYLLDLSPDQLHCRAEAIPAGDRLVVVDDCALSGARLTRLLRQVPGRSFVIGLLAAPAPLVQALEKQDSVEAVHVGLTLTADSSDVPPWADHLPGDRLWLGRAEPVVFPWNEPDQVLWNARTERLESDWHRVSPRRSLDVWNDLGLPRVENPGPLDLRPGMHWRREGDRVILWDSEIDQAYGLEGVAADMWRALVAFGDMEAARDHLETRYEVPPEGLRADLEAFVEDGDRRGFWVRGVEGGPA